MTNSILKDIYTQASFGGRRKPSDENLNEASKVVLSTVTFWHEMKKVTEVVYSEGKPVSMVYASN